MNKCDIQNQRKFDWVDLMDREDTVPELGHRQRTISGINDHVPSSLR